MTAEKEYCSVAGEAGPERCMSSRLAKFQIAGSILEFINSILQIIFHAYFYFVGIGIWGSILSAVTGVTGSVCARNPRPMITCLVLSVCSSQVALILVGLHAFGLSVDFMMYECYYPETRPIHEVEVCARGHNIATVVGYPPALGHAELVIRLVLHGLSIATGIGLAVVHMYQWVVQCKAVLDLHADKDEKMKVVNEEADVGLSVDEEKKAPPGEVKVATDGDNTHVPYQ